MTTRWAAACSPLREPNEPRSSKNCHALASASRWRHHAIAGVFAATRPSPVRWAPRLPGSERGTLCRVPNEPESSLLGFCGRSCHDAPPLACLHRRIATNRRPQLEGAPPRVPLPRAGRHLRDRRAHDCPAKPNQVVAEPGAAIFAVLTREAAGGRHRGNRGAELVMPVPHPAAYRRLTGPVRPPACRGMGTGTPDGCRRPVPSSDLRGLPGGFAVQILARDLRQVP